MAARNFPAGGATCIHATLRAPLLALKAGALGDAVDSRLSAPEGVIANLHVTWGHTSAQQLRRVMVDSDKDAMGLVTYVDEVLEQCGVCRASDKAADTPIAGTSTASASYENYKWACSF